jgi:hypothetical protein
VVKWAGTGSGQAQVRAEWSSGQVQGQDRLRDGQSGQVGRYRVWTGKGHKPGGREKERLGKDRR